MNRKGFTLLELIVALVIFATVITAAYTLFDSSRHLTARAEFRSQLFQTARAALQSIEDDLRGAVMMNPVFDTGFIGTNAGSEKEPLDRIDLLSVSRYTGTARDITQPPVVTGIDAAHIAYWIEQDTHKAANGLVRIRPVELTPPNGPVQRDEDIVEIARDVVFLNLKYFDGSSWLDTWDSTQTRKLPKAVEATVYVRGEWKGEDVTEAFTTRFYLPVAAETPERSQ